MSSRYTKLCTVAAVLILAGCSGKDKDQIAFDGVVFKTKTSAVDKKVSLADFTTTISGVANSLDGARQAAAYEGTKYCIKNYGTSKIDWTIGPDTDPAQLSVVDGSITFRGQCDQ